MSMEQDIYDMAESNAQRQYSYCHSLSYNRDVGHCIRNNYYYCYKRPKRLFQRLHGIRKIRRFCLACFVRAVKIWTWSTLQCVYFNIFDKTCIFWLQIKEMYKPFYDYESVRYLFSMLGDQINIVDAK